jgi:dynein heavy chain, axonemal
MIKLWIHETCRVFHDRLVSPENKRWFNDLVIELVKSAFRLDWSHADLFESKPLIFGDFMKRGIPYEERQYDEIRDIATMS